MDNSLSRVAVAEGQPEKKLGDDRKVPVTSVLEPLKSSAIEPISGIQKDRTEKKKLLDKNKPETEDKNNNKGIIDAIETTSAQAEALTGSSTPSLYNYAVKDKIVLVVENDQGHINYNASSTTADNKPLLKYDRKTKEFICWNCNEIIDHCIPKDACYDNLKEAIPDTLD